MRAGEVHDRNSRRFDGLGDWPYGPTLCQFVGLHTYRPTDGAMLKKMLGNEQLKQASGQGRLGATESKSTFLAGQFVIYSGAHTI